MDIFFMFCLIGVTVWGFNRLLRWARREDRKTQGKTLVEELERWMNE